MYGKSDGTTHSVVNADCTVRCKAGKNQSEDEGKKWNHLVNVILSLLLNLVSNNV